MACRPIRRAFTLIELLVSMGIISILMGLLLPAMGRVADRARQLRCASNLRQHAMLISIYASQFDDFAPYCYEQDRGRSFVIRLGPDESTDLSPGLQTLEPYMLQSMGGAFWQMPMVDRDYEGTTMHSALQCPEDPDALDAASRFRRSGRPRTVTTVINSYVLSGAFLWDPASLDPQDPLALRDPTFYQGQRLGSVLFPSRSVLLSEAASFHDPRSFSRGAQPPHPYLLQIVHADASVLMLTSDQLTPGIVPDPTGAGGLSTNPLDWAISFPPTGVRGPSH